MTLQGRRTHFHSDVDNQRKTIAIEVENLLKNIEGEATRALQNVFNDVNRIRGLHSRWNTLSPVSRIPPEILCEIFLQLKALDRVEDHLDVYGQDAFHNHLGTPWQVVSHVCQTWRSVALNCAALWSRISFAWDAEHISEFASRSKQANLEIYNASDPEKDHIFARLFPRIEVLHVHALEDWDWNFCDSADLSAPLLKDLTFIGNVHINYDNISLAGLLCSGAAPQLQKLHLVDHAVDWPDTFRHPNLKYLHIDASCCLPPNNGTCARLLAALAAMPHLETLKLLGCLPSDLESLNPFRHFTVALPRLQSIYLQDGELPCANLLPFLSISPKCAVWAGGLADDSGDFVGITHCLIKLNEHFSCYCMVANEEHILRVIPISDSYPDPGWEPKHNFGNRPELIIDDAVDPHEVLRTATSRLQVARLTVKCTRYTFHVLGDLFAATPALQALLILGESANAQRIFTDQMLNVPNFVNDVLQHHHGDASGGEPDVTLTPLPQLRELVIIII